MSSEQQKRVRHQRKIFVAQCGIDLQYNGFGLRGNRTRKRRYGMKLRLKIQNM